MATKLRNEVEQLLLEGIRKGLKTDVDLARYARIHSSTLQEWRRKAARGDKRCVQLVAALEREHALRRAYLIMKMEASGGDDWRMWDRLLALSDPKNYGKEQNINANVTGDVSVVLSWGDGDDGDDSDNQSDATEIA